MADEYTGMQSWEYYTNAYTGSSVDIDTGVYTPGTLNDYWAPSDFQQYGAYVPEVAYGNVPETFKADYQPGTFADVVEKYDTFPQAAQVDIALGNLDPDQTHTITLGKFEPQVSDSLFGFAKGLFGTGVASLTPEQQAYNDGRSQLQQTILENNWGYVTDDGNSIVAVNANAYESISAKYDALISDYQAASARNQLFQQSNIAKAESDKDSMTAYQKTQLWMLIGMVGLQYFLRKEDRKYAEDLYEKRRADAREDDAYIREQENRTWMERQQTLFDLEQQSVGNRGVRTGVSTL